MSIFPQLKIGWLNGWIPGVVFYLVFFILLRFFPKKTVERLYDHTGWTLDQARPAKIGLPFAVAALLLLPFSPLQINQPLFWVGLTIYLMGFSGFIYALHTFNITPLNEPVTGGLYEISRNPQWVSFAFVLIGISLMVGSWIILALVMVRIIMNHFRILGEERALAEQYGQPYRNYKEIVPRYLLFF
jgi:protein-S-isoprenylcysteine O-methyltransferase Ste14